MSDTAEVTCPSCHDEVPVPVTEMVRQRYRMSGADHEVTLLSLPPTLAAHLKECHDQPQ